MTTRRIDRILMGLGALLILFSSYQLFFAGNNNSSAGIKLGTLTSTLSVVKTKNALALDWRDASSGNDLTENQLIYTDSESSAQIIFNEGSALEIGENSLVKLRSSGKEQSMDLSKGFIRAKLDGKQPFKVQMNGEDYLVSGNNADIQINIQDEKGEIGVLNGEVKIEGAGVSENLTTTSALEIDGEKLTKKAIYFQTLTPEKSSIKYVLSLPLPVKFSWSPDEDATIHVSKKPDLKNAVTSTGAGGLSIDLNPGLYYFKVESQMGVSLVSSFRIIQETAPKILRPVNGDEVSILEDVDSKILLQWKGESDLKYLVEWNDGEIHQTEVSGSSTMIPVAPGTSFSWRLKIKDQNRPEAVWSEWQNIKLTFVPKPLVPTNLIPNEVEYQTYDKPNEKIELMWKTPAGAELEVKDPDGQMETRKLSTPFAEYLATKAGTFQWRVRAIDSHLRSSPWSDWKTFAIEDLSGQKDRTGIQRIQLKKPDQRVTFNWKAEDGTTSVFELSKDPDFKIIVRKIEVKKDSAQVNVPEMGSYYWRSRQFLPDGTFNVSEPKKVIIEPTAAPEKPEKLPDLEVPLEELPVQTTFIETIFNFFISSAHADELKGVVKIDLPIEEEAKGYVVRIFADQALTKLVFEEQLTTKHFEWINARAGTYYWQYAIIDFWDRRSLFSDPARLSIKADVRLPEKPKLLSPIRAIEIDQRELVLRWTPSVLNRRYRVDISETNDFKKITAQKESKTNEASFADLRFEPKLHYWRVTAFNKRNKEVVSNTGRFIILPHTEKILIADIPPPYIKVWKSRGFVAWAPSKDSYTFTDVETGTIDGIAMMSALLSGTIFRDKYIYNGELLRQTGEVFEGEKYLFQRILIDGIYLIGKNPNHKWGVGLAVGQSTGQAYEIENGIVKSSSASGPSYGPAFRNYLSINELWEMQGRAQYLLGEIKQIEFGADAIRKYKTYLLLGGLSYSTREYVLSTGKQNSIKVSLGFGKEF